MNQIVAAIVLFAAIDAQASFTRNSRLPLEIWRQPKFRIPPLSEKIVHGEPAEPHSIPYIVSLQSRFGSGTFCGAAVLSENEVLSAAHCCDGQNPSDVVAVAGDHDQLENDGTEQRNTVSQIIMHPSYNPMTTINDICILRLEKPFEFNEYVSAVQLPTEYQEFEGTGRVSGWGSLWSGGPEPTLLMYVDLPLISDEECGRSYGYDQIQESHLCAGGNGKDSCQGDSGGPLICDGVHCGVVSWGYGCATEYPGVYTQTSYYLSFIKENMKQHL